MTQSIINAYQNLKLLVLSQINQKRTTEEVFSRIYRESLWKSGTETEQEFCSGRGSHVESIVEPYKKVIIDFLASYPPSSKPRIVDLGCGDFNVGNAFINYSSEFIGIDVVPDLIKHHNSSNYGSHVKFICSNIIEDDLPPGDICFIRQVLQHLSNQQISKILGKLNQYKIVFITEMYPTNSAVVIPNRDKNHGKGIRMSNNSGVYLDQPPFDIDSHLLTQVLEVPGAQLGNDPGVIRTYKLEW